LIINIIQLILKKKKKNINDNNYNNIKFIYLKRKKS